MWIIKIIHWEILWTTSTFPGSIFWEIQDSIFSNIMDWTVPPSNSFTEIRTPSTSECDCIWRQGLWRGNYDKIGFPGSASGKEPACHCRRHKRPRINPWVWKILWRRAWQTAPVFLLENSMDRGSWWATVHRVTKSQTWLKWLSRQ